jgi:polyphosphate kinase
MMHRNLDRRVEVLVRVPGAENPRRIEALLDVAFAQETDAWELGADGQWRRNDGTQHLQDLLIRAQSQRRR